MVSPALRADFAILDSYVYRPGQRLPVPFHVFTGRDDREVDDSHLGGWMDESRQPGVIHHLPGGHFFLHERGAEFLSRLREVLA